MVVFNLTAHMQMDAYLMNENLISAGGYDSIFVKVQKTKF